MRKKLLIIIATLVYLLYSYAIITNNDLLGDILSPILVFIISGIIFNGFVIKQSIRKYICFGWILTLSIFSWFLCDLWWGIQTLILHTDPEENFFTLYGYSLTNLFIFIAICITGYQDLKRMNKIQAMLDTLIVSINMGVMLWLFVFEQSGDKVVLLLNDPISMACILVDIIIYAWINVCLFSTRLIKPPFYHRLLVTGVLIFVIIDFIYFYLYFYSDYEPNSWVDGVYMLSFSFIAASTYFKSDKFSEITVRPQKKRPCCKLGIELCILFVPVIVFIFKRDNIQYFILLVVSLLIYYVLINYTQKSIFQGQLLEMEKKNVQELERKVEERTEEITKLMNTDFVSGLYNRRYFEAVLSETIKNIKKNQKISLLYLDQNKSKAIKNLYGKEIAEKLLKELAKTLNLIVAESNGLIAAHGDDIFVIMLKGNDADKISEKLASKIIKRCNRLFFIENHAIRVTLNIGISCYPEDTLNVDDLIKNADIAMVQARIKGFNKVQHYDDRIGNLAYNRHRIELDLKSVGFDKEFQLYYQPQVYCVDGTQCGFEALIRWFEGGKNFIPPLDFIPVAEEIGMIIPLGYWIMENAAKQYSTWKTETGQDFRIAVNVSSKQLVEVDFVQRVDDILKKYKMKPQCFEIEITESQQIENDIGILETLNELKKLGISIAIDDFGTGYSSLNYIKNFPVDRIKVAKELIDNIENDIYSNAIIKMVISIAKVRGIKVIAEGVETKEQWDCLKSLECDEIQGYYFAKPMPANELKGKWINIRSEE